MTFGAVAKAERSDIRTDIQGLRAIAVLLVLSFHVFPDRLPGGFVGVDVFFAISGFLMTRHLLARPPRHARDVTDFWARRLRRLLPAGLLVIAVTVVAACLILPATRLAALGVDALASALYAENWRLAASAVDYLGATAAASPLQHYWSLGVEEQFYLVWPFVIGLLAFLAARRGGKRVVTIGLGAVVVASLVTSVVWTTLEPASAYFVTPTRLWELGAGGLVAAALTGRSLPVTPAVRALLAWAGLAMIAAAAVLFSALTPFPGMLAAIPVAGACLVLIAESSQGRYSPTAILRVRPVQLIGDASYSIYLWHFPVLVLVTYAVGGHPTFLQKIPIIVASLVLAQLTKVFVEDPARRSNWLRARQWRTFAAAAAATVLVLGLSVVPTARVQTLDAAATAFTAQVAEQNAGCFGAQALAVDGCAVTSGLLTTPGPTQAWNDLPPVYDDGCLVAEPFSKMVACHYGVPDVDAEYRIALVGNSHAAQWLPALQELAADHRLSITTYLASRCTPTSASLVTETPAGSPGCLAWGRAVMDATTDGGYDLVVTSTNTMLSVLGVAAADQYAAQVSGYQSILAEWADKAVRVLVIRDSPVPGFDVAECVAGHPMDFRVCNGARSAWVADDPMLAAVEKVGSARISTLDLTDLFCSQSECYAVIGGVLVYADTLHFDATFSRTLAPYLAPGLDDALRR